ncbi:MAG: ABC transporter permease [Deltaproteobacteria bacterium]
MSILNKILKAIKDEIIRLSIDHKVFLVLIIAPLFLITLYGLEFSPHTVLGVRTIMIDKDNSSLSRKIVDGFRSSEKFQISYYTDDEKSIHESFCADKADAAIIIPKNFMKDVINKQASEVLVVANGNNMIISNTILQGSLEIIETYSKGTTMKMLGTQGITPETARNIAMPIGFSTRIWYNPTFNYSAYLVIGILALILQQVTMMFIANSFVINRNTIGAHLISMKEALYKIIGITIVHFTINYINFALCLQVLINVFKMPFRGSMFDLMWFAAIFLLVIIALGIFLSLICRSAVEATQYSIFFAVPSFLLSGYTWPRFMMITPIKMLSSIFPVTYFADPMRRIFLMGADISYFKMQILVLSCAALVLVPLSMFIYLIKAKYFSLRYKIPINED